MATRFSTSVGSSAVRLALRSVLLDRPHSVVELVKVSTKIYESLIALPD